MGKAVDRLPDVERVGGEGRRVVDGGKAVGKPVIVGRRALSRQKRGSRRQGELWP
jgi:hypothetical protein